MLPIDPIDEDVPLVAAEPVIPLDPGMLDGEPLLERGEVLCVAVELDEPGAPLPADCPWTNEGTASAAIPATRKPCQNLLFFFIAIILS